MIHQKPFRLTADRRLLRRFSAAAAAAAAKAKLMSVGLRLVLLGVGGSMSDSGANLSREDESLGATKLWFWFPTAMENWALGEDGHWDESDDEAEQVSSSGSLSM